MAQKPNLRRSVRALVLDTDHRVLLVRYETSDGTIWATPGGGIDPGESPREALTRELHEELGLADPDIGPHVWTRRHHFELSYPEFDGQDEFVYLVRCEPFDPIPTQTEEELAREGVREMRWWSLEEMRVSELLFAPRRLGDILENLIADGPPSEPFDSGI